MKSRSSTGVGQKIDLDYNIETMRISDSGTTENTEGGYRSVANSVMDRIKTTSQVTEEPVRAAPRAVGVETNKLKQMLAGLKSSPSNL
jgi:hypothetical protein